MTLTCCKFNLSILKYITWDVYDTLDCTSANESFFLLCLNIFSFFGTRREEIMFVCLPDAGYCTFSQIKRSMFKVWSEYFFHLSSCIISAFNLVFHCFKYACKYIWIFILFKGNLIPAAWVSSCTKTVSTSQIKPHYQLLNVIVSEVRAVPERNGMEGGFFSSFYSFGQRRGGKAFPFSICITLWGKVYRTNECGLTWRDLEEDATQTGSSKSALWLDGK